MARFFFFLRARFLWLAILSYLFGFAQYAGSYAKDGNLSVVAWKMMQNGWKLTQYHLTYFDFGFVKRGLVGTLIAPLFEMAGDSRVLQVALVVALDVLLFAVFLTLLYRALLRRPVERDDWPGWVCLALLISPLGIMQWSYDLGRFDHANFVLLAFAVAAVLRRRPLLAGFLLGVAVLVHEAVLFYGAPLLLVLWFQRVAPAPGWRETAALMLPAAIAAVFVLAFGNVTGAAEVEALHRIGPGARVWQRGVFEPAQLSPELWAVCLAYLAVLVLTFAGPLTRLYGSVRASFLLGVPLCLFALGVDYFRWLHLIFAVLVTALLAGAALEERADRFSPGLVQKIGLLLLSIPLGPIGINWGLPFVQIALGQGE